MIYIVLGTVIVTSVDMCNVRMCGVLEQVGVLSCAPRLYENEGNIYYSCIKLRNFICGVSIKFYC